VKFDPDLCLFDQTSHRELRLAHRQGATHAQKSQELCCTRPMASRKHIHFSGVFKPYLHLAQLPQFGEV
jgi:hypothetical protein